MKKDPSIKDQIGTAVIFNSDDTNHSDLSYNTSEEDEPKIKKERDPVKNIQLMKNQMNHFFIERPELKRKIEEETKPSEIKVAQNKGGEKKKEEDYLEDALAPKKTSLINEAWKNMSGRIIKESKKQNFPSIEYINQRLNIFRANCEKPSLLEILTQREKETEKFAIKTSDDPSAKEKIKELEYTKKIEKESGGVEYYAFKLSNRKKKRMKRDIKEREMKKLELTREAQAKELVKSPKMNPSVFDRLSVNTIKEKPKPPEEFLFDSDLKTQAGKRYYQELKTKNISNPLLIQKETLTFLRKFTAEEEKKFDQEKSHFNKPHTFTGTESKDFNFFLPDLSLKNKFSQKEIDQIFTPPEFFDENDDISFFLKHPENLIRGRVFSFWKDMQDSLKI